MSKSNYVSIRLNPSWYFRISTFQGQSLPIPGYRLLCVAQGGGGILHHPKYFGPRKRGLIYNIPPTPKRNFHKRLKSKSMAFSRKNLFKDFLAKILPKFCFCNYERIFSLEDLKFGGSVYLYMRNKRGKLDCWSKIALYP